VPLRLFLGEMEGHGFASGAGRLGAAVLRPCRLVGDAYWVASRVGLGVWGAPFRIQGKAVLRPCEFGR